MNGLTEKLKEALEPLYKELLKIAKPTDCAFCMQWGKNYPTEQNAGILFVGKAVNSWITDEKEIDVLFGNGSESIFDRADQMQWVEDMEGGEDVYNTRKSAFWRDIKQVSQ